MTLYTYMYMYMYVLTLYMYMYVLTLYMHICACIQGDWVDDERSGEGEFTYNTGDVYRGRWSEDRQSEFYTPCHLVCMMPLSTRTCIYSIRLKKHYMKFDEIYYEQR